MEQGTNQININTLDLGKLTKQDFRFIADYNYTLSMHEMRYSAIEINHLEALINLHNQSVQGRHASDMNFTFVKAYEEELNNQARLIKNFVNHYAKNVEAIKSKGAIVQKTVVIETPTKFRDRYDIKTGYTERINTSTKSLSSGIGNKKTLQNGNGKTNSEPSNSEISGDLKI